MKRESNFRAALVQAIRATHCIAVPIETGTTNLGVPDLFVRTSKVSAWIELKNEKYPLRFPYVVHFRPGQAAWLERHYQLGGLSILGIATVEGNFFFINNNIRRIYVNESEIHELSGYICNNIIGKSFVKWLDNL